MKRLLLTLAFVPGFFFTAHSQTGLPTVIVQGVEGPVLSLSGDIGTYGELYSISGRESRRPLSTARLYFRPTISLYNAMSFSFNFLLSTEGSSRSASHSVNQINQYGIWPQWSWGYANAGDFTETFTPYTLSGIQIRGGGVSINPGLFRFSAIGGYTRRTGAGGEGGFDRYLYGGKVGIGRDSESYFDILFVRTRDIPSRFQISYPDSISSPDSTQVGTEVNPYQETPQENLVVGLAGVLKLFDNVLSLTGELSSSAFTRDMNSMTFDNDKIPSFIRGIYTPRLSSNADYAFHMNMNLNLANVGFKAGYRRIGPGFNSLGVASLITDQREIMLGTNLHFARWSTNFTWKRQNDNLLQQKIHTTSRQTFTGNIGVRPVSEWNASFMVNVLSLRNYASTATEMVHFLTLGVGTNHSVFFGHDALVRSASVSYMFQKALDHNPLRQANGSMSHMVSVNSSANPTTDFTIVPAVSIVASRVGLAEWKTIQTFSLTPQYRTLDNQLVTSLMIGLSSSESNSSLQLNATVSYRLTPSNMITLMIRRTGFNSDDPASSSYSEHTASLTVSQRL